jgi:hypothetical protein
MLNRTTNFIDLFVYAQGETEIPKSYYLWSAISLIAASVGKNVTFQKFKGSRKKMCPNLYVILLGDSASGKGGAIEEAEAFADGVDIIGKYRGEITRAHMVDKLSVQRRVNGLFIKDSRLYLMTPELGQAIKTGTLADEFVKFMTEIFTGGGRHQEGTRSSGEKTMEDPCVNWIAGTTEDWLLDSISPSAISGGFFARTIVVRDRYNDKVRIHEPKCPDDAKEIRQYLHNRVAWLSRVRGQFIRTYEAIEVDRAWYEQRDAPTDERLRPIWKRAHDIVLKLSMVLCLAETTVWDQPRNIDNRTFVITAKHASDAISLLTSVRRGIEEVISLSSVTADTKYLQMVKDAIGKSGTHGVAHSTLLRRFSSRGLSADNLHKLARTLADSNQIESFSRGRGLWYRWKRMRRLTGGDHA